MQQAHEAGVHLIRSSIMTQQNNNNQTNGSDSIQDAVGVLVRAGIRSLSSPFLLNRLATHPLIGNLLMFLLTGGTVASGILLLGEGDPAQISAAEMCERIIKTDIKPRLGQEIDSTDIELVNSQGYSATEANKSLFSCNYKVIEDDDDRKEDFQIVYQVVEDDLVDSVVEEEIGRSVLEDFCKDEDYYTDKLKEQGYNPDTQIPERLGLKLYEDPNNAFYPVFRWKCMYKLVPINVEDPDRPIAQPPVVPVGLDLDPYCKENYEQDGLTVARYRYFNDPDSLNCVNPNF